jgi:hypothetical protein
MPKIQHYLLFIIFLTTDYFSQNYYFERNINVPVTHSSPLEYPWAGGINSSQISKIDLNNDGFDDLFIFDRTGNKILTFVYNTATSKYEYAPQYESKFPKLENWAILRDYNCDGKKDIFTYVFGGMGVWKNTSTATELSFEYVTAPYVYTLRPSIPTPIVSNLFVSKVDLPDVNDIDGDGDMDVLTFSIIGETLEYHRNMSVEYGYSCDSIIFELKNDCWGHFLETGTGTNKCILFDTCTSYITAPQIGVLDKDNNLFIEDSEELRNSRHSGSSVTSLDLNGDGVKDVLLGDVSFNNIVALYNDNTGVNMNTSMISQDTLFPVNTIPAAPYTFPAGFYEDIDNDGIKDLIVTPNVDLQSDNSSSVWYYKNYGTTIDPVFQLLKKDLFQENMIEVGMQSFPILTDYDGDGLVDLIISNFGYFTPSSSNSYQTKISVYKNTGTVSSPSFLRVTDDFLNLSGLGFTTGAFPAFADIDNDGDLDMILGDYDGKLHLFTNSSGNFTTLTLSLTTPQLKDDNNQIIDVGYGAKPTLFDINNDGDFDLIVGEENGNLNYYENVGGASMPIFRQQSDTWGNIDVSEWWTTIGNSAPVLFKNNQNETQLFVGSERGYIFHYDNIDGNLMGTFNVVDTMVSQLDIGPNSCPAVGNLNNDTLIDLIIGTKRGGVALYYGSSDISISIKENTYFNDIKLFPNPANDFITIASTSLNYSLKNSYYSIYDNMGRLIIKKQLETDTISIQELYSGFYLLVIENESQRRNFTFIKK